MLEEYADEQDGGDGDEEGMLLLCEIGSSFEDEDEIGGIAVHPLIELCPDELSVLPLLVNGGNGIVSRIGAPPN